MRRLVILLSALAIATPAAADMSMSFDWGPTKKCDSKSPPISVKGVPDGTARLQFSMTDLNVPDFRHGGGTVDYSGQKSIPYGAFRYKGPCPPSGKHKYRITVKALDAKKKTLATAAATQSFPK
ncbi:hypothetical protein M8R20_10700 [Pseudomonas sp. R2.Fl]|nr:hypothetical protein [Pseudomonas sp. R2.Fl]